MLLKASQAPYPFCITKREYPDSANIRWHPLLFYSRLNLSLGTNSTHSFFKLYFFLLQLNNTKSVDNRMTLMHFLADVVDRKYPDLVNFDDELIHVVPAARGT